MTLRYVSHHDLVDDSQVNIIRSAGGSGLDGYFSYGSASGWELTLRKLTLSELLQLLETVKTVLR